MTPTGKPEFSSGPIRVAENAAFMHVVVPRPRWRKVLEDVAAKHGIDVKVLVGRSKPILLSPARQEAAYRMRMECGLSYPQLGRALGGRDHSTIIHAVRRHAALLAEGGEG